MLLVKEKFPLPLFSFSTNYLQKFISFISRIRIKLNKLQILDKLCSKQSKTNEFNILRNYVRILPHDNFNPKAHAITFLFNSD